MLRVLTIWPRNSGRPPGATPSLRYWKRFNSDEAAANAKQTPSEGINNCPVF